MSVYNNVKPPPLMANPSVKEDHDCAASEKNGIRLVLLLATFTSLFFVPWLLVKAWILPLPSTIEEQLDQAINHGFDGVVLYVEQGDQPAQTFTAGWHNKQDKIAAQSDALFKIASISKL